jgi:hypothetical protein
MTKNLTGLQLKSVDLQYDVENFKISVKCTDKKITRDDKKENKKNECRSD